MYTVCMFTTRSHNQFLCSAVSRTHVVMSSVVCFVCPHPCFLSPPKRLFVCSVHRPVGQQRKAVSVLKPHSVDHAEIGDRAVSKVGSPKHWFLREPLTWKGVARARGGRGVTVGAVFATASLDVDCSSSMLLSFFGC